MATRTYPQNQGKANLMDVYGVNLERDKKLKDLINPRTGSVYTYQSAKESFPAFAAYWEARGFNTADFLSLYEFECAWNDWVWHTDTYLNIGIYIRPNFVTQSRGWIEAPDGWYRVAFGCQTGLGMYSGRHAQVYSDRSGNNPGCTPGTAIEIDHAGWLSQYQQDRVCLNSTAWGKDYGVIGGLAYTEGIIIENFRLVGGRNTRDTSIFSTGATMNEPGENSVIRYCMAEHFNDGGYTIFNGTPTEVHTCSAFFNNGPGFDLLGSNGLCNVTLTIPSGDNNRMGLIRIRPRDAQSVGGGTINIRSEKNESRTTLQQPIRIEGAIGDLNMTLDNLTANFEGVTCPELIYMEQGNQFEINARGIDLRSNTQALFRHAQKGWALSGGRPYGGNSFVVNDDGLAFRSRPSMVWNGPVVPQLGGGTVTPPVDPPPTGSTSVAFSVPAATEGGVLREAKYLLDGNASTFGMMLGSMTNGQKITVTFPAARKLKGVTFPIPPGYTNSYPRKFEVRTANGGAFSTRGTFTGGATSTATWTERDVLTMEIICREANSNYWGAAELSFA